MVDRIDAYSHAVACCVAGTCLGPCSCKLTDIMAVVVQANALDKGGGEQKSRRDGAKERWFLKKYRIVWYGV